MTKKNFVRRSFKTRLKIQKNWIFSKMQSVRGILSNKRSFQNWFYNLFNLNCNFDEFLY
jgi:hypothetical protein